MVFDQLQQIKVHFYKFSVGCGHILFQKKDPAQQSHWPGSHCLMSAYSKLHHPVLIVRQIFTFSDLFFIIRLAFSYTTKYNTVFSTSE